MKKIFIVVLMVGLLLRSYNIRSESDDYEVVPDIPFESIAITGQVGKESKKNRDDFANWMGPL